MKHLVVTVRNPFGNYFDQEIEWREDESIKTALGRSKKIFGQGYKIVDWHIVG